MSPFRFVALTVAVYGSLALIARCGDPEPQTAPAIVTPPTVTVALQPPSTPAPTTSSTTTSTTAVQTAHDALQADLEDATAFALAELDPALPCLEWAPLALEAGWPAEELPTLLRVIWKESRCQPEALNPSSPDHGLTQINAIHEEWLASMGWTLADMMDPAKNLRFAYLLWNSRTERGQCGWTPWSISCS